MAEPTSISRKWVPGLCTIIFNENAHIRRGRHAVDTGDQSIDAVGGKTLPGDGAELVFDPLALQGQIRFRCVDVMGRDECAVVA